MKTSHKILIGVACFIFSYLILFLVVLRNDMSSFIEEVRLEDNYQEISVEQFDQLSFSANWEVKVLQDVKQKIEISLKEDSLMIYQLENHQGILYFSIDSSSNTTKKIHARVTSPTLKGIKAKSGSSIYLYSFDSDTLNVIMEDGGRFTGRDNKIKHFSIQSSEKTSIELIDTTL